MCNSEHQAQQSNDHKHGNFREILPNVTVDEESRSLILAAVEKNLPGLPVQVVLVEAIVKTQANKWRPVVTRVVPSNGEHVD